MIGALARGWEQFWFRPAPTSTLALLRIAYGALLFVWAATLAPDLLAFLSDDGATAGMPPRAWYVSLLAVSPSNGAVVAMHVLLMVGALCLMLGLRTRLAAICTFVVLYSFQRRNPYMLNAGDRLLLILGFYLVLAPSGVALSLDRWRRHRSTFWEFPDRAPWVLRLFQIQSATMYLFTVWEKVRGRTWNDGTAVGYAMRIGDLERLHVPEAIVDNLVLINVLTWGTLAVELSLAILVWNRVLRPWVLLLGVLLHLGIDLTLNVGFFSYVVFVSYIAWLSPHTAANIALSIRDRIPRRSTTTTATADAEDTPGLLTS